MASLAEIIGDLGKPIIGDDSLEGVAQEIAREYIIRQMMSLNPSNPANTEVTNTQKDTASVQKTEAKTVDLGTVLIFAGIGAVVVLTVILAVRK